MVLNGSIVSEHYILTTAQCLKRAPKKGFTMVDNLGLAKRLKVNTFILHPDYDPTSGDNNIGLIYIEEAFKKNMSAPLALNYRESPDHEFELAGFGPKPWTEFGASGLDIHHLYETTTISGAMRACEKLKKGKICRKQYLCTNQIFPPQKIYAPKSGGPLFVEGSDKRNYIIALQVTELDPTVVQKDPKILHFRISKYCDWIAKNTNNEVKCQHFPGYNYEKPRKTWKTLSWDVGLTRAFTFLLATGTDLMFD
uniref:Peptidase S1 domain-containing protein n=1 Tax=Panagrolaimus sp. JU765 TaxID=591449 RepID=A0AC34PYQ8_9BILA